MTNLWPWIAVAGLGAFHGLSPASGWMFAAAWGVRARDGAQALRALLPIAVGHAASVGVVACAFAQGMSMDRTLVQLLAGALLVGAAAWRFLRRGVVPRHACISAPAGHAGIALWSFLMATAHGAGMMLVPALVPLCLSDNPAREITASGSLTLALAAVGVHTAAMLIVTGAIAAGVCRGFTMHPRLGSAPVLRRAWTALLAVTGVLLMALR
ncbi:hypothetical protein QTI66_11345 [Variovorax sp. J22R133]|uniref:hypothetical protein n=1 Tax=Variovorax brevis TaxID=3053503 RepID=UPI0025774CE3|nr:hypothetical protein [Variovorax sp. J22R133]MDM0112745.1 hypothetical protein [Variovorax sp. J22R133]